MSDYNDIIKSLSEIEDSGKLPKKLLNNLKKLKHGLSELQDAIEESPIIATFMKHIEGTLDSFTEEDDGTLEVFITKNDNEKETWLIGTEDQFFKKKKLRFEDNNDEDLGYCSFSFVKPFLNISGYAAKHLEKAFDKLLDDSLVRGILFRELMRPDGIDDLVWQLFQSDGIAIIFRGYESTQNEFEFDGKTYIYFRCD